MKKKFAMYLLIGLVGSVLIAGLVACGPSYGHYGRYHNDRYGYNNTAREAFDQGYRRGFDHGSSDRRQGYNYDFDHSSDYRRGISRDRYVNDRYREGYERGYRAGYYGRR